MTIQQAEERPLITSDTDPIRVDFLPLHITPFPGRIGMTIAPGKQNLGMQALWRRDLDKDLAHLTQHYRVEWLITLLQEHEFDQLKIPHFLNHVQTYGMRSHWFPIQDFGTPTSMAELIHLVEFILGLAEQSHTVVIHCKAGLGRTGLVTASCLVALGYSPQEAFMLLRDTRPGSVETPQQEAYVAQFAEVWGDRSWCSDRSSD